MAQRLTPAVLAGKQYRETVDLELDGQIFEVEIRPLTHLEKAEIQAIEAKAIKVHNKQVGRNINLQAQEYEINAGQIVLDSAKAKLKLVELGTTDPEWTEKTINELWKPEWIEQVANRIAEISGLTNPQDAYKSLKELESFREEQ